jgi:signal transduction histidine kinase
MRGRHDTLGVLYLDTLTPSRDLIASGQPGKFTEDHLSLAIALAHQAALAIEDTRFYQAMLQAERLAAVGQTIAAVSHHIKNILQGLRSGGEILTMGLADGDLPLLKQGWKIVEKNQSKIYDLVMDMLTYSKEREPSLEDVDLNAIVADVVELTAAQAQQRGIDLRVEMSPDLPLCSADPEGLHRALLNLVGNALDAAEDNDTTEEPTVVLATHVEPSTGWLRLEVRDNGKGIPAEKIGDIFRPFVSSKGGRGTGLGLPVSRKILREHGGDLQVSSVAGAGSVFAMRLPRKSSAVPDKDQTREFTAIPPPDEN